MIDHRLDGDRPAGFGLYEGDATAGGSRGGRRRVLERRVSSCER